jgi:acyl-CoA synthetase (AMP-forming)/AMP-acid ligase II
MRVVNLHGITRVGAVERPRREQKRTVYADPRRSGDQVLAGHSRRSWETPDPWAPGTVRLIGVDIAGHKYPRRVWFVDELPKGPTGKILKRAIEPPVTARKA